MPLPLPSSLRLPLVHLADLARAVRLRLDLLDDRSGPAGGAGTLILSFNSIWGQYLDAHGADLGAGCTLGTDLRRYREAAAVVFHIPTLGRLPLPPKLPGQIWVALSQECEVNYPRLRDPAFMRRFDLRMTYRRDADIIMPYTTYYISPANLERALRRPPQPKRDDALAVLLISSRIDRSGRLAYAAELMRHLPVHSYGTRLRNRRLARDDGRRTKIDLLGSYRFTLAFENAIGEDYVTEKYYDPLVAGSVPVYLGAPNVADFAPGERCAINVADFAGPRALADYLRQLASDEAAYAAYFAWKAQPLLPAFRTLLAGQVRHPIARLSEAVRAQRGGRT